MCTYADFTPTFKKTERLFPVNSRLGKGKREEQQQANQSENRTENIILTLSNAIRKPNRKKQQVII